MFSRTDLPTTIHTILYYDISGNKCAVELLYTGRKESFPGQAHLRSKCAHNVKIFTNTGEQQDDGGLPRSLQARLVACHHRLLPHVTIL